MKKMPSVFRRNYDTDRLCRNEVVPGCEWVLRGEGVASRKWDGTACMILDGELFKRYDRKPGRDGEWKPAPEGWEPCQEPDEVTKHWPGWVPVGGGPEDQWLCKAYTISQAVSNGPLPDGTYEAVGPRINGGNEPDAEMHQLVRHGAEVFDDCPRSFDELHAILEHIEIEGIVFHHPDGRMAKVKRRDFGLPWPIPKEGG